MRNGQARVMGVWGVNRDGDRGRRRRALARCVLFETVGDSLIDDLAERAPVHQYTRRQLVHAEGEEAANLHVVVRGRVRLTRAAAGGRELTMDYRGPGEVVGETAIVGAPRPTSARAIEDVETLRIPTEVVQRLFRDAPAFAGGLARFGLERSRELESRIEALVSRSVESRVARFLLDAAARHGVPDSRGTLIGVKFTHQEIASFVDSTRETVTLILRELKRHALIETDHRRVVVLDKDGLNGRI